MLTTVPVTALFFGTVSPVTPLSNLLILPPVTAVVSLGLVSAVLLCVPVLRYLAPVLLIPAGWLGRLCLWVVHLSARLPLATVPLTGAWPVALAFVISGGCLLALKLWEKRRKI